MVVLKKGIKVLAVLTLRLLTLLGILALGLFLVLFWGAPFTFFYIGEFVFEHWRIVGAGTLVFLVLIIAAYNLGKAEG